MADDNGPRIIVTGAVLTAFAIVFVALRLYCKFSRHRQPWWDDAFLILALMCLITTLAIYTVAISHGFGKRFGDFDLSQLGILCTLHQAGGIVSLAGAMLSKTSFALTLLRVGGRWLKILLWFIIISMNLAMIVDCIMILLECSPLQKAFDPLLDGRCWDINILIRYGTFAAAYSGVMDFALAIIPWTIVWQSQMPIAEKFGVAIAMSMGIFAGVVGFLKASAIANEDLLEAFYDGNLLVTWMMTEMAVTIMAACIPTFRPLVVHRFRKYTASRSGGATERSLKRVSGTTNHSKDRYNASRSRDVTQKSTQRASRNMSIGGEKQTERSGQHESSRNATGLASASQEELKASKNKYCEFQHKLADNLEIGPVSLLLEELKRRKSSRASAFVLDLEDRQGEHPE